MRLDIRKIVALAALVLLASTAVPSLAYNYSVGSGWQVFTCWEDIVAPDPAFGFGGTSPDGYNGINEPFTFTLGSTGYFRITDVGEVGDSFRIWNNGALVAETPIRAYAPGWITSDPDAAFGNDQFSWAQYEIGPGTYSVQFQDVQLQSGPPSPTQPLPPYEGIADAYFRVDPVPEPASLVLLGLGLGVTGLIARRRQRA